MQARVSPLAKGPTIAGNGHGILAKMGKIQTVDHFIKFLWRFTKKTVMFFVRVLTSDMVKRQPRIKAGNSDKSDTALTLTAAVEWISLAFYVTKMLHGYDGATSHYRKIMVLAQQLLGSSGSQ